MPRGRFPLLRLLPAALAAGALLAVAERLYHAAGPPPPDPLPANGLSWPGMLGLGLTAFSLTALPAALLLGRRRRLFWWLTLLPTALVYTDHLCRYGHVPGLAYHHPTLFLVQTLSLGALLALGAGLLLARLTRPWMEKGPPAWVGVAACAAGPLLLAFSLGAPSPVTRGEGPAGAPNILLLTVDTLRQDALGAYGGPSTPGFDAWIARGVRTDGWAPAGWTRASMGTLFSGLAPTGHGGGVDSAVRDDVPWWPRRLQEAGWRTRAFVTNPQLLPRFGFARGFDVYDHAEILERLSPVGQSLWARWIQRRRQEDGDRGDKVLAAAGSWLARRPEGPWLLWVHLIDPHLPYHLRGPDGQVEDPSPAALFDPLRPWMHDGALRDVEVLRRARFADDPAAVAALEALYRREVGFVDHRLPAFWEAARRASGDRPLLWVLASDHGEEFADHGGFEHGHTLHDELLRVPLAVGGMDLPAGAVAGGMALADVGPTLLSLAGLPAPALTDTAQLAGRPASLQERVVGHDRSLQLREAGGAAGCDPPSLLAETTLYGPPLTRWVETGEGGVLRDDASLRLWRDRACTDEEAVPLTVAQLDSLSRSLFDALDRWRVDRPVRHRPDLVEEPALRERLRSLGYVH